MRSRGLRRWSAVIAAGLLVAACGSDDKAATTTAAASTTDAAAPTTEAGPVTTDDVTPSTDAAEPETPSTECAAPVPGSVLNYAAYSPTTGLDPLQSSGALAGGTEIAAIYDVLMRWDKATNDWVPHAAESLTPNDDFTEWTLKIRPEVTYANGEQMTAQDVLDNMARLMGPGRNATRGLIERVDLDASEATDAQTAVFKLFKPWSNFGYLLGDAAGMVPNPTLAAAKTEAGPSVIDSDPAGAGAGPFEVARWAPGESPYLVLKARADYWGGSPCVETINFLSIPADSAKADAMETGEVDVAFMRTQSVIDEMRAERDLNEIFELQSGGIGMLINAGVGTFNPITTDVRFRKALRYALDPTIIRERAYDGVMLEQIGLLHPDSAYFDASVPETKPDMDKAKELVAELKADGWDGKIRAVCAAGLSEQPITVKTLLETAGMDVDMNETDVNGVIKAFAVDKDFDLACSGLNISDSAILRQIGFQFGSDSTSNRIGFKNADVDAAIDELFAAPDLAARRAAMSKISTIIDELQPVVPYGAVEEGVFFAKNVSGIVATQQSVFLLGDVRIDG